MARVPALGSQFEQTAGQEAIYTLSTENGQGRGWQVLAMVGDRNSDGGGSPCH